MESLHEMLAAAPPLPAALQQGNTVADDFRAIAADAAALHETHRLRMRVLELRGGIAKAKACEGLEAMLDADAVDRQVSKVDALCDHFAAVGAKLPELYEQLVTSQMSAKSLCPAGLDLPQRTRRDLIHLVHDMVKVVARDDVAPAMQWLRAHQGDDHFAVPAASVQTLQEKCHGLSQTLSHLLASLDKLDAQTAVAP